MFPAQTRFCKLSRYAEILPLLSLLLFLLSHLFYYRLPATRKFGKARKRVTNVHKLPIGSFLSSFFSRLFDSLKQLRQHALTSSLPHFGFLLLTCYFALTPRYIFLFMRNDIVDTDLRACFESSRLCQEIIRSAISNGGKNCCKRGNEISRSGVVSL